MKNIFLLSLLVILVQAKEFNDTFKLRMGGYLISDNETTISATTDKLLGSKLDLQDDLGMDTRVKTFRLDGYYRFNNTHKIEFAYYSINTDSEKTLNRDVPWDDKIFAVGVSVNSHLYIDIYKLDYAYSFYHNDKVELSLSAGLHMMNVDTGIRGEATLDGNPVVAGSSDDASFLAPLPVIGFRIDYAISPRFHINGSVDYFGLSIDKYSGRFTDIQITAEYQILDNIGAGIGLNSTSLDAEIDDGTKYELNQQISGLLVYLSYNY